MWILTPTFCLFYVVSKAMKFAFYSIKSNFYSCLLLSIALCTSLFFLHSLYDNRFKNKYVAFITISGTLRESTIDSHIHSRLPIIQIKNAIRFLKAISTLPSMLKNAASADSMSVTSAHPSFPLPSSEPVPQKQSPLLSYGEDNAHALPCDVQRAKLRVPDVL